MSDAIEAQPLEQEREPRIVFHKHEEDLLARFAQAELHGALHSLEVFVATVKIVALQCMYDLAEQHVLANRMDGSKVSG